jgi:lipopolysaccharide/colanic/teichoic acid biosynthesis glycosyltransferase
MYKNFIKRIIDLLLSTVAIIVLLPVVFIPVCILLLLTGEHDFFYFQERIGFKNKPFYIWKFVTMLKNSENMASGSITLRDDPRVTTVGKYLRKWKLNELPQFFNIWKGDMSIIGPRPLLKADFDKYPEEVKSKVYNVKPGLSGIASIVFRDEERYLSEANIEPHEYDRKYIAPHKGELEKWYQENVSFYIDAIIIYYTVLVILNANKNYRFSLLKGLPERPSYLD